MTVARLPSADLAYVCKASAGDLEAMAGMRLLLTGGTGFVGSWVLESLLHATDAFGLGLHITAMSRNPERFLARHPWIAGRARLAWIAGDVRELTHRGERFDLVIHAATDASAQVNREQPLVMLDTIVAGTRAVLEVARQAGAGRVLMLSSGAVYGKLPPELTHVTERHLGGPDQLDTYYTYAESKRMAELLSAIYARQFNMTIPVARLFSFVGPRLPLDSHFAIGNFIRDGLRGGPIRIMGDGTAVRSYMYVADLVVWLLAILARGKSATAYNVGSDHGMTILETAELVAHAFPGKPAVTVAGRSEASNPVTHYVPDTSFACTDLGLPGCLSAEEGIRRTVEWLAGRVHL